MKAACGVLRRRTRHLQLGLLKNKWKVGAEVGAAMYMKKKYVGVRTSHSLPGISPGSGRLRKRTRRRCGSGGAAPANVVPGVDVTFSRWSIRSNIRS